MPIFRVKSEEIYTGQKKFTRAPPVAPVTNMRYADTDKDTWPTKAFKGQEIGDNRMVLQSFWRQNQLHSYSSSVWKQFQHSYKNVERIGVGKTVIKI